MTNKELIKKYMPRFLGRCVHNAKIESFSSRADYTVSFYYKRQIETALEWGEDPDRIMTGQTYFTQKTKAEKFVRDCKISNNL